MTAVYRVGLIGGKGVKYNHLNGCIALLVSKHGRKEVPNREFRPQDILEAQVGVGTLTTEGTFLISGLTVKI